MRKLLSLLGFGATFLLYFSQAGVAGVFDARKTELQNGLRVVVVENNRAPVVTQILFYKAGAIDEPLGKSGIAHLLEHLMFKGTDTLGPGEFSAMVARNGGQDNAFTSQDMTAYYQSVSSDRLEMIMRLEADRMANLNIASETFEPELQVVIEERNQRVENDPGAILREQSARALFRNHPYGNPIIGWRHELDDLSLADAVSFHERFYAPNNAILVIAGDVKAETVFDLAEKYYGPIPANDLIEHVDVLEPPLRVSSTITYSDPRVQIPGIIIRKPAPSWGTQTDKISIYSLDVLNEILSSGATGRLYRSLVIDQGIAVSAGGWYQGDQRGPGLAGLFASPSDGYDLDQMETALRAEIDLLVREGVSEDEVRRAIVRLQDASVTARDSLSGPAMAIGRAMMIGMSLEDIENWPDLIGAVTVDDVNAAARRVYQTPGEVITRLLPALSEEDSQ